MNRFYRALLRLYPTSFRADYDTELVRTFEASVRDRGRVAATIAAIGDVAPNAIAAHWEILRQDLAYTARTRSSATQRKPASMFHGSDFDGKPTSSWNCGSSSRAVNHHWFGFWPRSCGFFA